jgi:polyhydroxyalkanoate synthesis regulator phasin
MADIQKLEADIKETNRLLKILDEYATSEAKRLSEEISANKNALKALEKKVTDLEKKGGRK